MKLLTIFFLSLFTVGVFAQPVMEVRANSTDMITWIPGINERDYDGIEGSPYLQDDFLPATINDLNKTQFVRFNAVDYEVEAKTSKGIMRLDLKKEYTITMLDGSDKKYEIGSFMDEEENIKRTFFEVLDSIGSRTLYKRKRKKFIRKQKKQAYQDDKRDKFVVVNNAYYLLNLNTHDNNFIEIPRKKKKFYNFFANHSKQVAQFVKKDKLDISNEDDLVRILAYYFSLQK